GAVKDNNVHLARSGIQLLCDVSNLGIATLSTKFPSIINNDDPDNLRLLEVRRNAGQRHSVRIERLGHKLRRAVDSDLLWQRPPVADPLNNLHDILSAEPADRLRSPDSHE